jgi:hypothetical protein
MKRIILVFGLALLMGSVITLNSCKKESTPTNNDSTSAQDASNVSNAMNATNDDATNAASTNQSISGKTSGFESLCSELVTVDSVHGVLTITYSGSDCNNTVRRQGTITVTLLDYALGARWKSAGATLQVVYTNLVITNIATGATYTLNGTHYLTNVTGGLAYQVMDGAVSGTVAHKHVSDNFTVTFSDGSQKNWSVRRTRTFSGSGLLSVKTITLSGDTMINGNNNVDMWGTNSNGDAFSSSLITPIVSNSVCGYYHPISGEYTYFVSSRSVDILFGVDASGNLITGSLCPFGFKLTYTVSGSSKYAIDSYWF